MKAAFFLFRVEVDYSNNFFNSHLRTAVFQPPTINIKHMKKNYFSLFILLCLFLASAYPCTTAVISGKATPDGRSMIWKLRDTDNMTNSMRYFNDGKYVYLGLVDSKDIKGEHVWGGSNSAGFAIMNSASFNVNQKDTTSFKDQEGAFMKLALQTCATLEELEQLLNNRPRPMGLGAHFGVIDAQGGAAFYEVNNHSWTKFDANTAPEGYVLRTNYSETGTPDVGYGFIRRQTATKIFGDAEKENKINVETILQKFSRCFYHPVFGVDYRRKYESGEYVTDFISSDDMITRHGSASNMVIQGVKKGELPDMNTVWVQVGFPETSVSLPLWVRGGENMPMLLQYDKELKNSQLNQYAMEWKNAAYPIGRSDGYHYLNMTKLINPDKTGYIQRIERVEEEIFSLTEEKLKQWRKRTPSSLEIEKYYLFLNEKVTRFYVTENAEK